MTLLCVDVVHVPCAGSLVHLMIYRLWDFPKAHHVVRPAYEAQKARKPG